MRKILLACVAMLVAGVGQVQAGVMSELYLTTGSRIYVVQGTSVIRDFATSSQNHALAVDGTVKTFGVNNNYTGAEYGCVAFFLYFR